MDKEEIKAVRERMSDAVHRAGFSIKEVCDKTGLTQSCFYNKKAWPSSRVIRVIARECGVKTDWILFGWEGSN